MREAEINPARGQQVAEPVPALHALDDRAVRAGERAEIGEHGAAIALALRLAGGRAVRVERVDDERALVEIDSGIQHRDAPPRGLPSC